MPCDTRHDKTQDMSTVWISRLCTSSWTGTAIITVYRLRRTNRCLPHVRTRITTHTPLIHAHSGSGYSDCHRHIFATHWTQQDINTLCIRMEQSYSVVFPWNTNSAYKLFISTTWQQVSSIVCVYNVIILAQWFGWRLLQEL